MSESVQHHRPPEATPVGHAGTRVQIHERPAWAISGWAGVLIAAVCIAACFPLATSSVPGLIAVPIGVAVIVSSSLVIVQPGHTKYVDFVQVQAESALRHVATTRPYDDATGGGTSLRGSTVYS